ncbi:MFS transporter [Sphaerimonospora mesophila]|uniref:MFS transporter n=1 Tax=Sphaerimonospora mesophila TaxID=37483 RepID=UPI0009F9F669
MMSSEAARRRYALIQFLTWLPPGLTMAPMVLLMSVRGLDIAQIGLVFAAYSAVIVVMELPTGGLADVIGRRVVLAVAAAVNVVGLVTMALADSVWPFLVASVLKGVARALSSGPAQAWYVDALHAAEGPEADLKPGLAVGATAGAVALTIGALTGGLLPLVARGDALAVPVWAAAGASVVLLVTVLWAMPETRTARGGAVRGARGRVAEVMRDVPATIVDGIRLGLTDRGLGRLLLVSIAAGVMLNGIELLTPGRLAALTGRADTASAAYAVVTALGFAANAAGSLAAPAVARLAGGSVRAAVLATIVVAGAVAALAASAGLNGRVGIVAAGVAYVLIFAGASVAELLRGELIHRRVASGRRATVMSVDSLQLQFGAMLSSVALAPLANAAGTGVAWTAAAVIVLGSALLYVRLPAPRPAFGDPLVERNSVEGHNRA